MSDGESLRDPHRGHGTIPLKTEICAILDFECFQHSTEAPHLREMGWISLSALQPINVQIEPSHLSLKDMKARRTFGFQKWKVHGLPFFPSGMAKALAFPEKKIPLLISFLYQQACTHDRFRVAYKGGEYERLILEKLGIPSIDLETFCECPQRVEGDDFLKQNQCGFHLYNPLGYRHCASAEVAFYRQWLVEQSITVTEKQL